MRSLLTRLYVHLVWPSMVARTTAPARPGLVTLPWKGPNGEFVVAVIGPDGAYAETVHVATPKAFCDLITLHTPIPPFRVSKRASRIA